MGEMADFYINQALEAGENPFGSPYKNKWSESCKKCGQGGLKWRETDAGWRLFENERVEHNRLKEHVCLQDQPNPEGFEDVD